jgi:DNA-binding GntR family transcriptional regulator
MAGSTRARCRQISTGGRIPERKLCAQFQASRTPLRETLKVLYAESLVFLLPNRGSRAAKLTTEDRRVFF